MEEVERVFFFLFFLEENAGNVSSVLKINYIIGNLYGLFVAFAKH
jgi:hypothetical protein